MSKLKDQEQRRGDRIALSLSAVVKFRDSIEAVFKEKTDLISISRSGAGFYLSKECRVGRLVSLIMAMPRHLRCYDREKELYRVWGLVQHCSRLAGEREEYHVGVAFVGRRVPPSYHENPLQSYRIAGMNEDGTWRIVESKTSFVVRKHPRYWVGLEVELSALDDDKNLLCDEEAATENISLSGMAVYSNLAVDVGSSVNVECFAPEFSGLAIVRNRQFADHRRPKLHLEFISDTFPVGAVALPTERDVLEDEDEEEELADRENAPPVEEFVQV
ncbi:MAG: hypothetical protein JSS81_15060 [Acidobacteria bacterium]|nr:hypothetical protein [Acidobacteriota bacterium]